MAGALAGRVALVTGASRGIGLEVARVLHAAGAWVGMVARGRAALERAAGELGGQALPGDVTDAAAVARIVAGTEASAGRTPDIVVNAAGAFLLAPVAETDPDGFRRVIEVNLVAPFVLMRAVLPGMLARRDGHIVTIGSVAGRQAFAANGAYSASKFGVRGLHAVLAAELRGTGVRATVVEPAATDTPLWDAIDFTRFDELPPRTAMLRPATVAEAVLFAVTRPPDVAVPNILVERS
jgi:NADP-dependent 3-hydroxy acid dehydrogenase YdfG